MTRSVRALVLAVLLGGALAPLAGAQDNRIDHVSPMAPELAAHGAFAVGVRTLQAVDRGRPDILNTKDGGADGALRPSAHARSLVSRRVGHQPSAPAASTARCCATA